MGRWGAAIAPGLIYLLSLICMHYCLFFRTFYSFFRTSDSLPPSPHYTFSLLRFPHFTFSLPHFPHFTYSLPRFPLLYFLSFRTLRTLPALFRTTHTHTHTHTETAVAASQRSSKAVWLPRGVRVWVCLCGCVYVCVCDTYIAVAAPPYKRCLEWVCVLYL